jgi:hypothetical protein
MISKSFITTNYSLLNSKESVQSLLHAIDQRKLSFAENITWNLIVVKRCYGFIHGESIHRKVDGCDDKSYYKYLSFCQDLHFGTLS